jgi:hypothetical protein
LHDAGSEWSPPVPRSTTPDAAPTESSVDEAAEPVLIGDLETASSNVSSQLLDTSGVGFLAAVLGGLVAVALGIGTSVGIRQHRR